MKGFALRLTVLTLALICVGGCSRRESGKLPDGFSPRVLLIGVDGADLQIIDRLIGEGKLPTFQRLEREGACGPLKSQEPLLSPLVWTTIATGRSPQDHGVLDFVEVGADGQPTPVTSARRRVPAIWNIASEYGKSVGFVGWYASYPAEAVRGFEVSDRLAFHQVRSARATSGATFPEKLSQEIKSRFGEPVPDLQATKNRFVEDPGLPLTPDGERRLGELSKIYATSEFYRRILPPLGSEFRADLLAVYFEGIDACGHLFMEDAPPKRAEVSDLDFHAFSKTVDRYYEYQDEVLADLLRLEGPDTVTLIVSDHGFKSGDIRPRTSGRADIGLAPLWHRLYGVLFVHGSAIRASRIEKASVLDITPTVLSLLRLPLSRELPGHPIAAAVPAGGASIESRTVERYPPVPTRAKPVEAPADTETVQKLMALGYLTGGGRSLAHDKEGRTASSYLNEGMARSQSGDADGALRAYGRVIELDPANVNALTTAASIYIKRREYDRAAQLLDRARAADPNNLWVHLQTASWNLEHGRYEPAEAELAIAERMDNRLPSLHLLRAKLENARNHPDRALDELSKARKLTDLDQMVAEILVLRAQIETEQGRLAEAEAALHEAERFVPAEQLASPLGDLFLARGDARSAVASFRQGITHYPESSTLERKLGETLGLLNDYTESAQAFQRAIAKAKTDEEREFAYGDLSLLYQKQKRESEAVRALEGGVAALPGSASLWGMLGAAHGREGDFPRAIAAYERSIQIKPTALACKTLAALLLETRGDRARARMLWKQSLALDPAQPDVQKFLREYGSK